MKISEKLISALLTVALGVMFIVLKQEVISIAMTVLGAVLIILGIMNLIQKAFTPGVIKIVIGAIVIVFGWTIVSAVLYIVAALLLVYGVYLLCVRIKERKKSMHTLDIITAYAAPAVCIIIALLLFFNQGGAVAWVFVVSGILLIVEGVLTLIEVCKK